MDFMIKQKVFSVILLGSIGLQVFNVGVNLRQKHVRSHEQQFTKEIRSAPMNLNINDTLYGAFYNNLQYPSFDSRRDSQRAKQLNIYVAGMTVGGSGDCAILDFSM